MVYLMSIEMFNKLSNGNKRFTNNNGNSYKEYILRNCNLGTGIRYQVMQTKTAMEALQLISNNNINYTHNYMESKIIEKDNIELEINEK